MSPCEAFELLKKGITLEYYRKDDDYWWTLYDDQPIYILWKYEIRIKQ